jgi:hypothetical protein
MYSKLSIDEYTNAAAYPLSFLSSDAAAFAKTNSPAFVRAISTAFIATIVRSDCTAVKSSIFSTSETPHL